MTKHACFALSVVGIILTLCRNIVLPRGRRTALSAMVERNQADYIPGFGHDWLLPFYDPLQKLLGFASYHGALVDQADVRSGQRVLEIGCGTGSLLLTIKRRHPSAEVVGLDPDPKALNRASEKAKAEQLPIRLDRGYAQELPYSDASFDRVFSAFMFHHLGSAAKERTLREVVRVLKPDGSLHLLDFGGATVATDGLMARMAHRNERLRDNFGDRIPTTLREAGFAHVTERSHHISKIMGRITYYSATVASAAADTASPDAASLRAVTRQTS